MRIQLFFLALFFSHFAIGQIAIPHLNPPLAVAIPESVGMSSDRLTRIDTYLAKSLANNDIPGAVAIVCKDGKIVYQKAFGYADSPANKPMRVDDIFRIASMTKAITSTALLMLFEEGHFMLDDPISRFIPEFKNPTVLDSMMVNDSSYTTKPAGKEITFRHLVTHTSGIGYGVIDGDPRFKAIYKKAGIVDLYTTERVAIGDNIKKLAKLPLHHTPGQKFTYSEGLDVAGYLIEIISGKPFDIFLRERLLDPMGMDDTWFYLPSPKANRLVKVQTKQNDKWVHFTDNFYDVDYPIKGAKAFFSGGAGLSSTAKDYATFLQMYLNKGVYNGNRFLSRKTIESIMESQIPNPSGGAQDQVQGLAFGVLTQSGMAKGGAGSIGTFTWGGYFNTSYFADPKENIIGVILKQTQRIDDKNNSNIFRSLVMQSVNN